MLTRLHKHKPIIIGTFLIVLSMVFLIPFVVGFGLFFIHGIYKFIKPDSSSFTIRQEKKTENSLFTKTLEPGSTGEDILLLQTLLYQDSSIYTGPASGFYGTLTKNAVSKFQKKHGLPVTGEADLRTTEKLSELYGSMPREFWLDLITTDNNDTAINKDAEPIKEEGPWGVAKRIEGTEYGWTMKLGMDEVMASPKEIFDALNIYRIAKGVHGLNWDESLATFAQSRADYLNSIQKTDDHQGFEEYLKNEDNVRRLGFALLGENASYGYKLNGTHVIEWMYAADAPHDNNQLDTRWSDVGIGVNGTATAVIFGGSRY